MPLNATDREKVITAEKEYRKKITLERKMQIELKELFTSMSLDFAALYAQTGTILDATLYADDIRGIVSRQYRRTAKAFSGQLIKFLRIASRTEKEKVTRDLTLIAQSRGQTLLQLIDEIDNKTRGEINVYIANRTSFDVSKIIKTTQERLNGAVATAKASLLDELERAPSIREIAAVSSKNFKQLSFNRIGVISSTTTQGGAEGAKDIERDNFNDIRNGFDAREAGVEPAEARETWISQGDSLVRTAPFSHRSADFQEKENGVYIVGGEALKFPGDRSLGASAGNTINCRCSSVTVIE